MAEPVKNITHAVGAGTVDARQAHHFETCEFQLGRCRNQRRDVRKVAWPSCKELNL